MNTGPARRVGAHHLIGPARLPTLDDVVDSYDRGGRPNPALDTKIRPLGLNADARVALVAFLRSLTGELQEGWRR